MLSMLEWLCAHLMEAEISEQVGAEKSERADSRSGYRCGYRPRRLDRVRDEANVASASPVMLQVHGQDRNMPRLAGENVEAYRTRLSMKGIISEWSGTKRGVLYALTALGYDKSAIEPFALQDPSRWAEFIIYLDGSKQSGINNLLAIDTEVQKVKEGSSKPAYGTKASCTIEIRTKVEARASW